MALSKGSLNNTPFYNVKRLCIYNRVNILSNMSA